jgi:hypothetical protein
LTHALSGEGGGPESAGGDVDVELGGGPASVPLSLGADASLDGGRPATTPEFSGPPHATKNEVETKKTNTSFTITPLEDA